MSSLYAQITGSANLPYSSSISVPLASTPITAQSVREGFQSLADRTAWLSGVLGSSFSPTDTIDDRLLTAEGFLTTLLSRTAPSYASLFYSSSNGSYQFNAAHNFVLINSWSHTGDSSYNVTTNGQTITASLAGTYKLNSTIGIRAYSTTRSSIGFCFFVDGNPITSSLGIISVVSGNASPTFDSEQEIRNVTLTDIITLSSVSQSVGVGYVGLTAAAQFYFMRGNLTVEKINDNV